MSNDQSRHSARGSRSRRTVPRHLLKPTIAAFCGAVAIALVVSLIAGVESRLWRLTALLAACAAVATAVALLPTSWRAKSGLLVTAFVAAAGVLPLFATTDDQKPSPQPSKRTNPQYLADLIRKGPFTEQLPGPLVAGAVRETGIADTSAVNRITAIALDIVWPEEETQSHHGANGYVEAYGSPQEATQRTTARMEILKRQYQDFGDLEGNAEAFCVTGNREWICGGTRGYVYVEASVYPDSNANRALATGVVSALLRYTDRLTVLASA